MKRTGILATTLVVGSAFALGGGCYGATQVTVRLTTDLPCSQTLGTAVYVGAPNALGATPVATTKACTAASQAGADNEIGTITVVPSQARDGKVEVRAVIAQGGQDPKNCAADGTDCIVQTRTFSFVEHSSQTIAIRLLLECLGTQCPEGQTCIGPGQCSAAEVSCADPGGCTDAGTTGGGGGSSGGNDGGLVTIDKCSTRGSKGVLASAIAIPDPMLSTIVRGVRGYIAWYGATNAATKGPGSQYQLHRTQVDGTADDTIALSQLPDLPVSTDSSVAPTALADGRNGQLVSVVDTGPLSGMPGTAVYRDSVEVGSIDGVTPSSVSAAGTTVLVGSTDEHLALFPDVENTGPFGVATDSVAATPTSYVSAGPKGVVAYDLKKTEITGTPTFVPVNGTSPVLAVTIDGTRVYAAGGDGNGKVQIGPVDNAGKQVTLPKLASGDPVTSLAVDGSHVFWTHGTDGVHYLQADGSVGQVAGTGSGTIAHVEVDADCIYLWKVPENLKRAILVAVPKPSF